MRVSIHLLVIVTVLVWLPHLLHLCLRCRFYLLLPHWARSLIILFILSTSFLHCTGENVDNKRSSLVFYAHVLRPFPRVSFAVIGCGWLQALRVAGVHLIMAKRGDQAHPPQTSPLNIFMSQVGLLISPLQHSQHHCRSFRKSVTHVNKYVFTCDWDAFLYDTQSLMYILLTRAVSWPCFDFLCNHPSFSSHYIITAAIHILSSVLPSCLHLLFLSSATEDHNLYRKPPIYRRTGTVQLVLPQPACPVSLVLLCLTSTVFF